MKKVLAVLVSLMVATPSFGIDLVPPKQYDHEPSVPYTLVYHDQAVVDIVCNPARRKTDLRIYGCTIGAHHDYIVVSDSLSPKMRDVVVRHEKAHVNGWSHQDLF